VTAPSAARIPYALIKSAHPEPSIAVTTLVTVMAVGAGVSAARCVLLAFAVLTGQLSVGWSNDVLDRQRDRLVARPDKPVAVGEIDVRVVAAAAAVALMLCVPLSLLLGVRPGIAHLVAVASAWSYNLGLKSTVWSAVPYAVSFGLAPVVVWWTVPAAPPVWVVVAGALLGVGAHGTNVLPDLEDDAVTGIRGLSQRLGPTATRALTAASLALAVLILAVAPAGPVGVVGWIAVAATAVLITVGLIRQQLIFPTTVGVAGVAVILLVVRSVGAF
jgi:4-hydroxybenzoate polyprenyltransferase